MRASSWIPISYAGVRPRAQSQRRTPSCHAGISKPAAASFLVDNAQYCGRRAFIGTLFLFIFVANWSALIPGIEPPTAHLETDAALASRLTLAANSLSARQLALSAIVASAPDGTPEMADATIRRLEESQANRRARVGTLREEIARLESRIAREEGTGR